MIGWGGLRLDSATTTCSSVCYHNSTYVPSNVFPAQNQSDMERLVVRMKAMGLNTIRVSFSPFCTNPAGDRDDSPYSFSDAQNMIKIANYYNFWIALRYDGNDDISTATTCWLNYWQPIVQQLGPLYSQIVWEPINEPNATVTALSSTYQQWINMTRKAGDQHFIVIENQCSNKCPYSDLSQGYPTVTDPLGKVLISLHNYMSYPSSGWTVPDAIRHAQQDYQAVLKGEQVTGWYALDTEGGPDPQVPTCNGPTGTTSGCPPDDMLPGSAGYANVSLAFIQTLTQLFDSRNPRIDWIWWPAGTWTDTPCAGTYGALQPAKITFDGLGTGGLSPYRFDWSFGDGGMASGSSVSHAYDSAGQYNVTLSVVDWMNRTATTVQKLTTLAQPPESQGGGGGMCIPCLLTPSLPTFLLLTIGTAYWFLTVTDLNFTRNHSLGHRRTFAKDNASERKWKN